MTSRVLSLSNVAKYNRNSLASRHFKLAADCCIILKVRKQNKGRNKQIEAVRLKCCALRNPDNKYMH